MQRWAMSFRNFGQKVRLELYRDSGLSEKLFIVEGLRIDFLIKIIPGLSQAKFSIYNLSNKTIKQISNTKDIYVRLLTGLHDGPMSEPEHTFYVNNALTTKKVPNAITELYCIDSVRKDFSHKQIRALIKAPTLKRYIQEIVRESGSNIVVDYSSIPDTLLKYKPRKPIAAWSGSAIDGIRKVCSTYGINAFEQGGGIKLTYNPRAENQHNSKQNDPSKYYKLNTVNMRSNPKIGVASLEIESIVDFNIKAGTILDTSELITADGLEGFDTYTLINDAIKASVSGVPVYEVLSIEHSGSSYTQQWSTSAMAIKAHGGTTMPTYGWYG